MQQVYTLFMLGPMLLLTNCARIIHGTQQDVAMRSTPPGAMVTVAPVDEDVRKTGAEVRTTTPGQVPLKRQYPYPVTVEKAGYQTPQARLEPVVDGWLAGNILFRGLIGLTVDLVYGAAFHLKPPHIDVTLDLQIAI
jgi:hypothetical protein